MSLSNRGLSSDADGSALNCRANTTWVGAIISKGRTRQSVSVTPGSVEESCPAVPQQPEVWISQRQDDHPDRFRGTSTLSPNFNT
jgi:hypothetical protein